MIKKLIISLLLVIGIAATPSIAFAQSPSPSIEPAAAEEEILMQEPQVATDQFSQAKVLEVKDETNAEMAGFDQPLQKVKLRIATGGETGKEIEVEHGGLFAITEEQKVKVGETVVITKTQGPTGDIYYITDKYRINPLIIIFGVFLALVVFFGKMKGLRSLAGLIVSILILIRFVVPQILMGGNPLVISVAGALAIAILSLYLAHGLNKRTTIALISTVITLLIAAGLAVIFVNFVSLGGTGSEEAIFLRMGPAGAIDLKGLLLGGIIIGVLGVLDDVTTSQAAAVDEIRKANPRLSPKELFKRGISVGHEHIASLVNTLALAYAGASFPLLLLFSISSEIPFWLTLNSEFIAEEIVRTLVGSTALILAVPISTFLAAHFLTSAKAVVTTSKKKK